MPRQSERQVLLETLVDTVAVLILDEDEEDDEHAFAYAARRSSDGQSSLDEVAELLLLVESSRYLSGRGRVPKSASFKSTILHQLPDKEFRVLARMGKASFRRVVGLIEGHPVFHNISRIQQAAVDQQLIVALDRLGSYGNGASVGRIQFLWGI